MCLFFIEGFGNTYLVRLELDSKSIFAPLWLEVFLNRNHLKMKDEEEKKSGI